MDVKRSKADGFMLRFPEGLRDRLKAAAEANGRSMNSEIILRLQTALDRQDDGTTAVWFPPGLLDRIHDEANRAETDPNLLIVDAVEKAYPPRSSLVDQVLAIVDEFETKPIATEDDRIFSENVRTLLGKNRAKGGKSAFTRKKD